MRKVFGFVLFLICVSFIGVACADNLYWVSFSLVNFGTPYTNYSYVMQIDALGNVTMPPNQVHNINWPTGPEITAMGMNSSNGFHLWIEFAGGNVGHYLIGESPFTATKAPSLPIHEYSESLQTPQAGGFLATVHGTTGPGTAKAFGLTGTGSASGHNWGLAPRTRFMTPFVGLSSDGRLAIGDTVNSISNWQLYGQALRSNGLPAGNPVVVANPGPNALFVTSPDVTNVVAGNRRFVVYRGLSSLAPVASPQTWSAHFDAPQPKPPLPVSPIVLQVIDGTTNARMGKQIALTPGIFATMFEYQTVAIDPAGQFVLFGQYNGSCDDLYFQALDATGQSSGSPMKIASCGTVHGGVYGLNILKN